MTRGVSAWRTAAMLLALAAGGASLSGYGFTPLYATPGMAPRLAAIQVDAPPHSRLGFLMKEQLEHELGRAGAETPRYRLSFTYTDKRYPRGVAVNNVASRYEIDLVANYTLLDTATGKTALTDAVTAQVSYDSSAPPYAGLAAEQDAEARVAEQAAVQIRLALSRYLLAHKPGA